MHIKSVTLQGFKSFANKIKLEFEPGLIAVVGPNGSGKSNIVDAILWVLGEQSAKLLRGESMEDVIFAGSSTHPPLGIVEASIVLDNSDKTLPVEYSEINISRRLFRSGEANYFLNGKQSKLNDIKELLSEAALGKGLYSIVSQGRIEEILSSKPEERRHVVDEAAGILKHRLRGVKTERKLKEVEEKISRANDIYFEIKRQVKPLERQAEDAKKYIDATSKLKQLETEYLVRKIIKQKADWDRCAQDELKINGIQKAIDERTKQFTDEKNELEREKSAVEHEYRKFIKNRELSLVINENINSMVLRIEQAIIDNERKINLTGKELDELVQPESQLQFFKEDYIEELIVRRNKLNNRISELSEKIAEETKTKPGLIQDLETLFSFAEAAHRKTLENLDLVRSNQAITADEIAKIDNRCKKLLGEKNVLELEMSSRRAEAEALRDIYGKKVHDAPKSKYLLPLIEHFRALPQDYENHILNILEQEIEGFLVGEKQHAIDLINTSSHALTILPLAGTLVSVREKNVSSLADIAGSDTVPFLNNIYVVNDIKTAIYCQEKYQGKNVYFIYKDRIFTPFGSVRFVSQKKDSVIRLKKRIGELDSLLKDDGEQLKSISSSLMGLQEQKSKSNTALQELLSTLDELRKDQYESKANLEAMGLRLGKLKEIWSQLDKEIMPEGENKEELSKETEATKVKEIRERFEKVLTKLENLQDTISKLNGELSAKKYEEASVSREIGQASENIENLKGLIKKREDKAKKLEDLKSLLALGREKLKDLFEKAKGISAVSAAFNSSVAERRDSTARKLEGIEQRCKQIDLEIEKCNNELDGVKEKINQMQIKKAEIKIKINEFKTQLEEDLETDIDSAVSSMDKETTSGQVAERIREIKSVLARMGPVNMIAVEELAALRERENIYKDQLNDLVESKRSLLQVVKELNSLMTSAFVNFFERFSDNFQFMAEEFFAGGRGKILLSDPDDILNSGIEIEIQAAAGKKFQSLSLLSGGERAMAALAFMFSLFISRPTPFCIMDEVDAALDDFNINRLVGFLDKMKKDSQIILITHQKRTMEIADIIFGVSMEPDGTSKILSQKLEVNA